MPLPLVALAAVLQPDCKAVRVLVLPAELVDEFIVVKPLASVGAVLLAVTKAVTSSRSPVCSPVQAAVLVAAAELAQTKLSADALAHGTAKKPKPNKVIEISK